MVHVAEQQSTRLEWIRTRLQKVEQLSLRSRRNNSRAIYVSLFASTLATAVAGFAAASGSAAVGSWRMTCGIVAVLTCLATVAAGLQKQLDLSGNLSRLSACVGKLRALEYAAAMGTRTLAEIDAECEEVVRQFPDFVA